jgi:integrase
MRREAMNIRLPFLVEDVDRHGNVRIYFRRKRQPKVRIYARPGTPEFTTIYHQLMDGVATEETDSIKGRNAIKAGTYRWLCTQYFSAPEFRRLDPRTQRTVRAILESTLAEAVRPDRPELFAEYPLSAMTARSVRVLRDRKGVLAGAADKRVKVIRRLFSWAAQNDLVTHNPARDVTLISPVSGGFHTWTPEEVRQFENRHPIGSKARLALALLLYTGVRRSDVVLLGRQHVRDGWLKFVARKNARNRPVTVELPFLDILRDIVEQSPCGELVFLVTQAGRPFTGDGFGNWFRDRCREAGLYNCSPHGLRKAGAALAAENGATSSELMAVFGWKTLAQAERYTRAAERKRLAAKGAPLLVRSK